MKPWFPHKYSPEMLNFVFKEMLNSHGTLLSKVRDLALQGYLLNSNLNNIKTNVNEERNTKKMGSYYKSLLLKLKHKKTIRYSAQGLTTADTSSEF